MIATIERHGLLLIFASVLIGQLGLPIPAIAALVVAGSLATDGGLSATGAFATSLLACAIADSILFGLGRRYGLLVLKTISQFPTDSDSMHSRSMMRFESWGPGSLIVAKFIPGWTTLAPPLAGALRVGWARFLVLSTAGSALWTTAGMSIGFAFAEQIPQILGYLARMGHVAAFLLVLSIAIYIWYRWRHHLKRARPRMTGDEENTGGPPSYRKTIRMRN